MKASRRFLLVVVVACAWSSLGAGVHPARAIEDERGVAFELGATWPAGEPLPERISNCVRCHAGIGGVYTDAVVHFAGSVHDRSGVSCDDCHGGDGSDDEFAHSRGDYIGTKPTELRARCATCHDAAAEVFRQSAHSSEGYDWRTPDCWQCHAGHATGSDERPLSAACTTCHGSRAAAATGEGESQILWKSRTLGAHGNRISVTMGARGAGSPLTLELAESSGGVDVVVRLATNGDGVPTSRAEDVIALIQGERAAYHLIQVEEGDGYLGEGVVDPVPRFTLSGGADFDAALPAYGEAVRAIDAVRAAPSAGGRLPAGLEAQLDALQSDAMRLIHRAPPAPPDDSTRALAAAATRIRAMIAETSAGAEEGGRDG